MRLYIGRAKVRPMSRRDAGILVHPTSLPGPFGIGDLGEGSRRFMEWAADAGQCLWQMLPLGPAGSGHSPYSSPSTFAVNPLLISPTDLAEMGWSGDGQPSPPRFAGRRVEFRRVARYKERILRACWDRFAERGSAEAKAGLTEFLDHPDQSGWLSDWSLFSALKRHHRGVAWTEWDEDLRLRRREALDGARREMRAEIDFQGFLQFVVLRQWRRLRHEARQRGIELLGDLPMYVSHDSADVWAHPELFLLDDDSRPLKVAGVPPDYFSETGQRWGNPLYRWDRMAEDGFRWWIDRLRANLRLADRVRLDHFRGFAACWEVDAAEETAVHGCWVPGPGRALFRAVREALGGLPVVAEDLGEITPDVHALRDALNLPGMRILQFGLDGNDEHHPAHYPERCIAYTGTHDNDTSRGWFRTLSPQRQHEVLVEVGASVDNVVSRMIETLYESRAETVVIPLQDLLDLDSSARMNRPGISDGNWSWRVTARRLTADRCRRLGRWTASSGRGLDR